MPRDETRDVFVVCDSAGTPHVDATRKLGLFARAELPPAPDNWSQIRYIPASQYDELAKAALEFCHSVDDESYRTDDGVRVVQLEDIFDKMRKLEALL